MKKFATLVVYAVSAALLLAQSNIKPAEFLKLVGQAAGGETGLDLKKSKPELEANLDALKKLLPDAPDQSGADAANASICVILAALGRQEEAFQVLEQIKESSNREKRKLHVIKITKGKAAAMESLKALLANPSIPPSDHVVYVEKFISTLDNDEKMDAQVVDLATESLEKTKFQDKNARVGFLVVKFQQNAVKAGLGNTTRLRQVLESIIANTPETEKTQQLLEAAQKTLQKIPAK